MTDWKYWEETDKRPHKYGWSPGFYSGTCRYCGERYMGAKRSAMCGNCAYAPLLLHDIDNVFRFDVVHSKNKDDHYHMLATEAVVHFVDIDYNDLSIDQLKESITKLKNKDITISLEAELFLAKESK